MTGSSRRLRRLRAVSELRRNQSSPHGQNKLKHSTNVSSKIHLTDAVKAHQQECKGPAGRSRDSATKEGDRLVLDVFGGARHRMVDFSVISLAFLRTIPQPCLWQSLTDSVAVLWAGYNVMWLSPSP